MSKLLTGLAVAAFFMVLGAIGGIEQGNLTIIKGLVMVVAFASIGVRLFELAGRYE